MDEEDIRELKKGNRLAATDEYKMKISEKDQGEVTAKKTGLGWDILRRMGWHGDPLAPTPLAKLLAMNLSKARNDAPAIYASSFGGGAFEDEDECEDVYVDKDRTSYMKEKARFDNTRQRVSVGRSQRTLRDRSGCLDGFVRASKDSILTGKDISSSYGAC